MGRLPDPPRWGCLGGGPCLGPQQHLGGMEQSSQRWLNSFHLKSTLPASPPGTPATSSSSFGTGSGIREDPTTQAGQVGLDRGLPQNASWVITCAKVSGGHSCFQGIQFRKINWKPSASLVSHQLQRSRNLGAVGLTLLPPQTSLGSSSNSEHQGDPGVTVPFLFP